ncbi:MAG: hypothetical protein QNK04_05555 [Myxococcota bacterium]|nr:hypothetical protein [Myxococcota bacterium]
MRRQADAPLRFVIALAGSVLLLATPAQAEAPLRTESLRPAPDFRMMWPAGKLESGAENGLSWHRVETLGTGEANVVVADQAPGVALDLQRHFLSLWLKVDGLASLSGIELRLGSGDLENHYAFPVPLFTDPHANLLRDGEWTAISFGFGDARVVGTPDRAAIGRLGLYVADRGDGKPVSVSWTNLALLAAPRNGVVSFTFDDGYDEHLDAAEWMARYGYRGTAYIIPGGIGAPEYMSLDDLRELGGHYGWEIAAHHETPFTHFDEDGLEATILGVKRYLREKGFDQGAEHLAYPLGKQASPTVRALVRKHFRTARLAGGGTETLPPADPHLLRVFNVQKDTTPEEIGAAAQRAQENREWLILMFHYLVQKPKLDTEYAIRDFRRALGEIAATGVRVQPLGEVWARVAGRPRTVGLQATGRGCPLVRTESAAKAADHP